VGDLMLACINDLRRRALVLFCAFDHVLLAMVTLGHCRPYQQVSGALYELDAIDRNMWGILLRPVVDLLLYPLEANHCQVVWKIEQRQTILIGGGSNGPGN
jgi:hypothetical protein